MAEPPSDNKSGLRRMRVTAMRRLKAAANRPPIPVDKEDLADPSRPMRTNWRVFIASMALIVAMSAWAIFAPKSALDTVTSVVAWVTNNLGWFYVLTATIIIVFMLILAFSHAGNYRLGPDNSRPQYSMFSWGSMLFAAGIGIDLLFFSVAEPLAQYYNPPEGTGKTIEAARQAVVLTIFHYGLTGWAMYAFMGLAFALFAYRYNMPLAIRSALYPLIGKRIHGVAGDTVDVAAMLGTIFGVATSLGIGVVQLNVGLTVVFGIKASLAAQIGLIVIAVGTATVTAVAGVDKGIKVLSEWNVILAILLLIYVTINGKTTFLLDALIMNFGQYLASIPGLTLETYAYNSDRSWMQAWTLFFWAWWVAWAPFIGLFLARISRGRSLRQFIIGTMTVPLAFIGVWISIFGNSALDYAMHGGGDKFGKLALSRPELAFYELLEQYQLAPLVIAVASIVGLLLFATSANSAALVMSNFCSYVPDSEQDGPPWMRIVWAVMIGILTIAMLFVGGIPFLQQATLIAGVPFAIVIYVVMFGVYRAIRQERHERPITEGNPDTIPYAYGAE